MKTNPLEGDTFMDIATAVIHKLPEGKEGAEMAATVFEARNKVIQGDSEEVMLQGIIDRLEEEYPDIDREQKFTGILEDTRKKTEEVLTGGIKLQEKEMVPESMGDVRKMLRELIGNMERVTEGSMKVYITQGWADGLAMFIRRYKKLDERASQIDKGWKSEDAMKRVYKAIKVLANVRAAILKKGEINMGVSWGEKARTEAEKDLDSLFEKVSEEKSDETAKRILSEPRYYALILKAQKELSEIADRINAETGEIRKRPPSTPKMKAFMGSMTKRHKRR